MCQGKDLSGAKLSVLVFLVNALYALWFSLETQMLKNDQEGGASGISFTRL